MFSPPRQTIETIRPEGKDVALPFTRGAGVRFAPACEGPRPSRSFLTVILLTPGAHAPVAVIAPSRHTGTVCAVRFDGGGRADVRPNGCAGQDQGTVLRRRLVSTNGIADCAWDSNRCRCGDAGASSTSASLVQVGAIPWRHRNACSHWRRRPQLPRHSGRSSAKVELPSVG